MDILLYSSTDIMLESRRMAEMKLIPRVNLSLIEGVLLMRAPKCFLWSPNII